MAADKRDPDPGRSRFQPLGLLTTTLVVALVLAIFLLPFLVLPLAILVVFYIGFAASDRARRHHDPVAPPRAADQPVAHRASDKRDDEPGAA